MKKHLFATTALAGLAAFVAAPAMAFDENNWTWTKDVTETVDINVKIDSEILPTGHFELQDSQIYNGDVVARTAISGEFLSNDAEQPADLTGTINVPVDVDFFGVLRVDGDYDANAGGPNIISGNVNVDEVEGIDVTSANVRTGTSTIGVQPSNYQLNFDIAGTASGVQEVNLADLEFENVTLDAATELASASGSATALANFKNIDSETATYLDESQVQTAANGAGDGFGIMAEAVAGSEDAPVSLAVELDASAISNLLTVNVSAQDPNNVFIGDVSQDTNANMMAEASAVQDLSGFNNLGGYGGLSDADGNAIVGRVASLTATAIGNFADIKVGPSVDLSIGD